MHNELTSQQRQLDLKAQVQADINKYLVKYNDVKIGQRKLAQNADIHLKTIQRLCRQENTPGHITILKLYKVLTGESNTSRLLPLLPKAVKESVLKSGIDLPETDIDYSAVIKNEILKNDVFCEIYFLIDTAPVTRDLIMFKFGEHGIHILEKMFDLNAVKYLNDGTIGLGTSRLQLDTEVIKTAGLRLSQKYSKPQNCEVTGENFIGLYVDSLPEEAYQKWLEIDKEAFIKKAEIAKQFRSDKNGKRVFTYMTTDTFKKSEL
ncbi:hypothetical protein [Bacteriovorax sp. DB6_IX]|uniref:hypothetical protein n=1 Tax=Bacteriovorax sp. DB6_IX TaxID=1353530 RepID=UPI00038A215D|nr:hypothetical protein [Bacteriovorax sp. DB6_IX]EQC51697.1 hypothetical protein M901_0285 [Bacteriovorax sp. DB6_IX]